MEIGFAGSQTRVCHMGVEMVLKNEPNVLLKEEGGRFIYVSLYVNDMLLVRNKMDVIKEVKKQLSSNFDMKDLSATKFIMGMEIKRYHAFRNIWLNQRKYI
jgi:hypothetical protein